MHNQGKVLFNKLKKEELMEWLLIGGVIALAYYLNQ